MVKRRNKIESREKILKAAAELFRQNGFEASGVDALMQKAGLTAGAFYAHFDSKSQLLEESLQYAFDRSFQLLTAKLDNVAPTKKIEIVFRRYLSVEHRDRPQNGCALVAIASELARQNERVHAIVAGYVERLAHYIEKELVHLPEEDRYDHALQMITSAVGSLLLSRLTKGSALSEKFLVN